MPATPTQRRTRCGFSLVELLLVIGIIAILVGLILAAVQKVRGTAVRTESQNHLRELGLALQSAHATHAALPTTSIAYFRRKTDETYYTFYFGPYAPTDRALDYKITVHYCLLPYLEQQVLADAGQRKAWVMDPTAADPTRLIASHQVKAFVAPADASPARETTVSIDWLNGGQKYPVALTSYAFNVRVFQAARVADKDGAGDYRVNDVAAGRAGAANTLAGVTDGLSNTMFFVEKPMVTGDAVIALGPPNAHTVHGFTTGDGILDGPHMDGVGAWGVSDAREFSLPAFGYLCNDPDDPGDDDRGTRGNTCHFTPDGGLSAGHYFHPPRPHRPPAEQQWDNVYPFSPGGVPQALLGDGSVRGVGTNVSVPAWSAAVTPAGGEAIGPD